MSYLENYSYREDVTQHLLACGKSHTDMYVGILQVGNNADVQEIILRDTIRCGWPVPDEYGKFWASNEASQHAYFSVASSLSARGKGIA